MLCQAPSFAILWIRVQRVVRQGQRAASRGPSYLCLVSRRKLPRVRRCLLLEQETCIASGFGSMALSWFGYACYGFSLTLSVLTPRGGGVLTQSFEAMLVLLIGIARISKTRRNILQPVSTVSFSLALNELSKCSSLDLREGTTDDGSISQPAQSTFVPWS